MPNYHKNYHITDLLIKSDRIHNTLHFVCFIFIKKKLWIEVCLYQKDKKKKIENNILCCILIPEMLNLRAIIV